MRQLWAGKDPRHNPAHRQRAAKHFSGVDPHQNVHDGKDRAAEDAEDPQQVGIVGREVANNVRAFEDIDNPGDQPRGNKSRDQRNKDVCQLAQRVAHRRFIFGLRLRFSALGVINHRSAHQRTHGVHHLRGLSRADDQLVLLPLLYIAADAGQFFQPRQIELVIILNFHPHPRHAVFQTQNIVLSADTRKDIAGEGYCFFHVCLFSSLMPHVRIPDARQAWRAPQRHPARLRSSEWPV